MPNDTLLYKNCILYYNNSIIVMLEIEHDLVTFTGKSGLCFNIHKRTTN